MLDPPATNDTDTNEVESPGVDNNEMESPGVDNETHDEPNVEPIAADPTGLRRSSRPRQKSTRYPDSEYVHTTVSTGKVNVMNPRMFSNAAVSKVIGMTRPKTGTKPTQITCNVFTTCGDELQTNRSNSPSQH